MKVQNFAYISVGNTLYIPKVDILWLHHIFRYHFILHINNIFQNFASISVGNTLCIPKVDSLWLLHIFRCHYILLIFNNLQNFAKISVGNTLYNPKADFIWLDLILWYHYIPIFSTCTSFYHSTMNYIDFIYQFYYKQREQFNFYHITYIL